MSFKERSTRVLLELRKIWGLTYLLANTMAIFPKLLDKTTDNLNLKYPNLFLPRRLKIDPRKLMGHCSIVKSRVAASMFYEEGWLKQMKTVDEMFNENPKYITALEIIEHGKTDVEDLAEYKFYMSKIDENGKSRGLFSKDDCNNELEARIEWYGRLESEGYRPQSSRIFDFRGEIEVAISKSGEMVKVNSGNHRFAAYLLHGFEKVFAHPIAIDEQHISKLGDVPLYKKLIYIRKLLKRLERGQVR